MKDEKNTRKEQNHEKNSFNPMCKSLDYDDVFIRAVLSDRVIERLRAILSEED